MANRGTGIRFGRMEPTVKEKDSDMKMLAAAVHLNVRNRYNNRRTKCSSNGTHAHTNMYGQRGSGRFVCGELVHVCELYYAEGEEYKIVHFIRYCIFINGMLYIFLPAHTHTHGWIYVSETKETWRIICIEMYPAAAAAAYIERAREDCA